MAFYLVETVGFESRLRAWSGQALNVHRTFIHYLPFESHKKGNPPVLQGDYGGDGGIRTQVPVKAN